MFITNFISELELIKKPSGHRALNQPPTPRARSWIPPDEGSVKINVDGIVSRDKSRGAFSVVCRNTAGLYLGSSAVMIEGLSDPEALESLAVREGLSLALDLNISNLKVASDCKVLVTDICNGSNGSNVAVLKEIK